MKSLALQPWTRFSLQWRLPSTNQLCAAEKPQNIFGPLYCGDNVSEAKAFRAPPTLPPPPPHLSASSTISAAFLFPAAEETPAFNLSGGLFDYKVPERIDRVKSRLLTPSVPKLLHSATLLAASFTPLPGSRHELTQQGEEDESGCKKSEWTRC